MFYKSKKYKSITFLYNIAPKWFKMDINNASSKSGYKCVEQRMVVKRKSCLRAERKGN